MTIGSGPQRPAPTRPYAGDVPVQSVWQALRDYPDAVLIDVRTSAEWSFVGVPDLAPLGKQALFLEWQRFPDMAVEPAFAQAASGILARAGASPDAPIFMLCRSGGRSRAAAIALTAQGFARVYNVADGFEGDIDGDGHRGTVSGWKAAGLPWRQS